MSINFKDLIVYFHGISVFKNDSIEFIFFSIIWQYYEFTLRLFMSRLCLFKITENSRKFFLKFLIKATCLHNYIFIFVNKKLFQLLFHIFYKLCKETFGWHSIESFILNIWQKQIFCVFIVKVSSIGLMFCKNIMKHALWLIIYCFCSMIISLFSINKYIFNISFNGYFSIF